MRSSQLARACCQSSTSITTGRPRTLRIGSARTRATSSKRRARRERPRRRCSAQCEYEFSPSNVGCHATLPWGVMSMQRRGRYHALAKERTVLLRCESLRPPMSQSGHELKSSWRAYRVCFAPVSRRIADIPDQQLRAIRGHDQIRHQATQRTDCPPHAP